MPTVVSVIPVDRLVEWLNEYEAAGRWQFLAALAKEIGGVVKSAGMLEGLGPYARDAVEHYHPH